MSGGGDETDLRAGWMARVRRVAGWKQAGALAMRIAMVVVAGEIASGSGGNFARSAEPIEFARDIAPIFAKHCLACHGPEKQQGGLRLDIRDDALAGGDSGRAIEPKSGTASLLYEVGYGARSGSGDATQGPRLSEVERG